MGEIMGMPYLPLFVFWICFGNGRHGPLRKEEALQLLLTKQHGKTIGNWGQPVGFKLSFAKVQSAPVLPHLRMTFYKLCHA